MELRPLKEKKEVLYPTITEEPKSNFVKTILLATALNISPTSPRTNGIYYVAVPSYCQLSILIRNIFIIIAIVSSLSLFVNKIKINKCTDEEGMEEQLKKSKKHRKIEWWIFGVSSISVIILTSILIICL